MTSIIDKRLTKLEDRSQHKTAILFAEFGRSAEEIIQNYLSGGGKRYVFWSLPKTALDE